MAQIKPDDQTICVPSTNLEINSVVLSSSGPWGYNAGTKTLTIPDINLALKRPYWDNESSNDTSFLAFEQVDGSLNYFVKRVHSRGSTGQQSQSFQNRGVGIEIIHSSENGNVLPAEPNDILDVDGAAERKYPNYCAYLWFDDTLGKFTHWWDTQYSTTNAGAWRYIKTNYNTLIVDGKGGGNFTKLSDAYAYLNSLFPVSGNPYSLGDLKPSATNFWTIYVYNVVNETVKINAQDFINVIFMPGGQLYIDSSTSENVLFDGTASSPIRGTPGKFSAIWTGMQRNSADDSISLPPYLQNINAYQIVGVSRNISGACVVRINSMDDISLSGLNVCSVAGTSTTVARAIEIQGDLYDSVDFRRRNVTLKECSFVVASDNASSSALAAVVISANTGSVYIDDCIVTFFSQIGGIVADGIYFKQTASTSPGIRVYINESIVLAPRKEGCVAIYFDSGTLDASILYASNSVFEAYGGNTTGFNAAAARVKGDCVFSKCVFRIPQWTTDGAGASAASTALSSRCLMAEVADTNSAIFDQCSFIGESGVSVGVHMVNNGTWADTKVVLNKCTVKGGLASVASGLGTTSTTKKFFGSSFQGPISGTPFGCAAATSTTGTNYLV